MATTFVEVLLQARDQFGEMLNGGFIYTYEAGSTTPLVTYQDKAGAVPNTNPVELDSAGMATIRQTDGVAYKWIIKDAELNTLFTYDNITVGIDSTVSTEIYPVHMTYCGTPEAGGFMGAWILEDAVTFPANFSATGLNASGSVKTNPAASYGVLVKVGGTLKGTWTIDTDGGTTFTTAGGGEWSGVKYDQIDFFGPASAGTAADFALLLLASVDVA